VSPPDDFGQRGSAKKSASSQVEARAAFGHAVTAHAPIRLGADLPHGRKCTLAKRGSAPRARSAQTRMGIRVLYALGADVNGTPPVSIGAPNGHEERVPMRRGLATDIELPNREGGTALVPRGNGRPRSDRARALRTRRWLRCADARRREALLHRGAAWSRDPRPLAPSVKREFEDSAAGIRTRECRYCAGESMQVRQQ
jgi:hypothetical protein